MQIDPTSSNSYVPFSVQKTQTSSRTNDEVEAASAGVTRQDSDEASTVKRLVQQLMAQPDVRPEVVAKYSSEYGENSPVKPFDEKTLSTFIAALGQDNAQ